jgi:hypothetical protein
MDFDSVEESSKIALFALPTFPKYQQTQAEDAIR